MPFWAPSGSGGGGTFNKNVSAAVPAGPTDNYVPAGYVAGTTNRLQLTPAAGGSTLNGLGAAAPPDGFTVLVINQSLTNNLIFANLAGTSTYEFECPNPNQLAQAPPFYLGPQGSCLISFVAATNQWVFV